MLSFIQLRKHNFAEIHMLPNKQVSEEKSDQAVLSCNHAIAVNAVDEEERIWIVRLRVNLVKPDTEQIALYTGAVEVFGEFELSPDTPETEREKHAYINGGAILYGAIREMVSLLTARSIHGMVELPTINPQCFLPQKQTEESKLC